MRLHYKGTFDGDYNSLPRGEHQKNAVPFQEPKTQEALAKVATGISIVCTVPLLVVYEWVGSIPPLTSILLGVVLALAMAIPHELLHGICFRQDVYLYMSLRKGMLFVVGPETMSKMRFIFMSLLPNLVFGGLPFGIFLVHPEWDVLGAMGMMAIPMGAGDYMNVWHAIRQMPKGARTYLYGFHSYWYIPEEAADSEPAS